VNASVSGGVGPAGPTGPQGPAGATGPQGPAGAAGASAWSDITGKPATFAPSAHTHVPADVGSSLGTASLQGDILQLSTIVSTLGTAAERDVPDAESNASAGQVVLGSDTRLSNARTPTSHVHGNINNAGAIGSTAGQIVVTTTSGVLTTAATIASSAVSGLGTAAVLNVGTGAGTVAAGNDSRLSDARTPTSHVHAAGDITTGTIATARLGSGTASASTFLRGDQTYATAGSTNAGDLTSGTLPEARLPNLVILHPFLLAGM
jgi:hypothetical protein